MKGAADSSFSLDGDDDSLPSSSLPNLGHDNQAPPAFTPQNPNQLDLPKKPHLPTPTNSLSTHHNHSEFSTPPPLPYNPNHNQHQFDQKGSLNSPPYSNNYANLPAPFAFGNGHDRLRLRLRLI
jgi:hypothetical protein